MYQSTTRQVDTDQPKKDYSKNLDIIESFLKYSCIKVNADKCHTLSYIYRDRKRFFEEEQFTISGNPIPVCNLAESIEYLGTDTTTTMKIRMQGIDCVVEETKQLIQNIGEAPLSLNQKLYAIRTFAIPKLDFVMMSGRVPYNTARDIDTLIRTTINKHIKGVNIPTDLFYTHWKDGGFSLIKLHDRAIYMRLKTFMTLYNSRSFKTRKAMRVFTEEERLYRKIQIIKEGEDEQFMNWKIEPKMNKGTDSISIHALRSAQKLKITIKTDEETGNIIKRDRKLLNTILRRISISACIGSYFIFHKMPFKEYKNEYESVDKEIEDEENILTEDDNSNDTFEGKEGEDQNTNDEEEGDDEQKFSNEGTTSEDDYNDDTAEGVEQNTDEDEEQELSNGGTMPEDDTINDAVLF